MNTVFLLFQYNSPSHHLSQMARRHHGNMVQCLRCRLPCCSSLLLFLVLSSIMPPRISGQTSVVEEDEMSIMDILPSSSMIFLPSSSMIFLMQSTTEVPDITMSSMAGSSQPSESPPVVQSSLMGDFPTATVTGMSTFTSEVVMSTSTFQPSMPPIMSETPSVTPEPTTSSTTMEPSAPPTPSSITPSVSMTCYCYYYYYY